MSMGNVSLPLDWKLRYAFQIISLRQSLVCSDAIIYCLSTFLDRTIRRTRSGGIGLVHGYSVLAPLTDGLLASS